MTISNLIVYNSIFLINKVINIMDITIKKHHKANRTNRFIIIIIIIIILLCCSSSLLLYYLTEPEEEVIQEETIKEPEMKYIYIY